jgi:hypothetical protein
MYDSEKGTTRQQNLRNQLSSVQIELARLKRFVHSLRNSSDADAAGLLARLRMGEDLVQLANAEPLHWERYVRFTDVYQSRAVKLTADGEFQSQNMLTILIYRWNILLPVLWKLERHA